MIPATVLLLAPVAGATVGSYVTTMVLRATVTDAPTGQRSLCDGCHRQLTWMQTIPVVSYFALKGRCRTCAVTISPYHPIGEIAGLAVGAAIACATPDLRAAPLAIMAMTLLAASLIDARTRKLPDLLTGIVAVMSSLLALGHGLDRLLIGLVAAIISAAILWGLRKGFLALRGQVGMGLGDLLLFSALALWLGLATPWMFLGSGALGLLVRFWLKDWRGRLATGPMIAAAGFTIGLLIEAGIWPGPL